MKLSLSKYVFVKDKMFSKNTCFKNIPGKEVSQLHDDISSEKVSLLPSDASLGVGFER